MFLFLHNSSVDGQVVFEHFFLFSFHSGTAAIAVSQSEGPSRKAVLPDGLFSNPKYQLGKFCRSLDWKMLIYLMAIWNILQIIGLFYDHLVHFVFIWNIFPVLVICTKKNLATLEKSTQSRGHLALKMLL
jgi:hypothetical protein